MKFKNAVPFMFVLAFFYLFSENEIFPQQTNTKKLVKILNNYGHIPFEDGKTNVVKVEYSGLDVDLARFEPTFGKPIPESKVLQELEWAKAIVKPREKFSGARIANSVKIIKEFLFKHGYIEGTVDAFGEELPNDEMKVEFVVKRGLPWFILEIRFDGAERFTNDELVGKLKECLGNKWIIYDPRFYEYCVQKDVRSLMYRKGFFRAKLGGINVHRFSGGYGIEIRTEEGTRFTYGTIMFNGPAVFSDKQLIEIIGWKFGEVADGTLIRQSIYEDLKNEYANKGYVNYDADFEPTFIEPGSDGLDGIVNIVVNIDEGRQYKVGKIEFVGIGEDEVRKLKEMMTLNVGEVYDQSKLRDGLNKINELKEFLPIDYQADVKMYVSEYRREIILGGLIIGEPPKVNYRDENIFSETPSLDLIIKTRKLTDEERKYYK